MLYSIRDVNGAPTASDFAVSQKLNHWLKVYRFGNR